MATLETIRNKAGILITVFIGLALVAFILTDLLTSGRTIFSGNANEIAVIDGKSVSYSEFEQKLSQLEEWTKLQYRTSSLDENTMNRIMDQNWNQIERQTIMNEQYEDLGLTVTDAEMGNLFATATAHPAIKQMFTDPNTGRYDEYTAIKSYKERAENPNPQVQFYWDYMLEQIRNESLNNKYSDLVKKGLYITDNQLNNIILSKQKSYNFDYVIKPFESVKDSTLTVSESEINSYYKEHLKDYKTEPSREIKYLTFEIAPSEEDRAATRAKVEQAKIRLENPEVNVAQFINRNSDNAPYVENNEKFDEISSTLKDFVSNAKVGDVYGPYFENDAFKLTKLVAIKQLPDSVKARHILIREETPNSETIADSLFNLAKNGADFASLARKNSEDQGTAINGGDLGWFKEGSMVKPFNDACMEGNKGDILKVHSQYGWHIINIQDKGKEVTKYELATFEKKVVASQTTRQHVYSTVTKFATENETSEKFDAAIKEQNLQPRMGYNLKINDRKVGNLESSRQLVKWAFDAELNETSPIFECGNQFVIAILTKKQDGEYSDVKTVSTQIKTELLKDKKAAVLIKEFNSALKESESLSSVAQKLGVGVKTATNVTFASAQVQGAGSEPVIAAVASLTETGKISQPYKGTRGVFVLKVTGSEDVTVDKDSELNTLEQQLNYKVYSAYDAIKKTVDIEDKRSNFY